MFGRGLLKGMTITLGKFFSKKETVEYPEQKIPMTERYRGGVLDLNAGKCIACGLCSMACPNAAIELASEKDENNKKRLTEYRYLSSYCLYCNMCIEACPTGAIAWDKNYEITTYHSQTLEYDCLNRNHAGQTQPVMTAGAKGDATCRAM